ncbi:MAG: FAD-binding protein [Coriobacteriales bacterium]|nr:FAD-binding protein [Coriobacteriales bacterium]
MIDTTISRRTLVGAALGAAVLTSAGVALADEALVPTKTVSADAVVIGSGTSGLIAATRAAELGKKIILVDKLDEAQVGGCSRYTAGFAAFEAPDCIDLPGAMSIEEYIGIQVDYHRNACNTETVRLYAENSGPAVAWLLDQGVEFNVFANVHQPVNPDAVGAGLTGGGLIDKLYVKALEYGVEFMFETEAAKVLYADGAAAGIIAKAASGEIIQIDAPAVVLACGGFAANAEMFEQYTGTSYGVVEFYGPMNMPTGDGVKFGLEAGGSLHHPSAVSYANLKLADFPGEGAAENILFAKQQALVWLNSRGKRFVTEELCKVEDWTVNGEACSQQDKIFSVFDSAFLSKIEQEGPWQGQLFTDIEAGKPIPEATALAQAVIADGSYECYCADTLEELAAAAGIDPKAFVESIEKYNGFCEAGSDAAFGKSAEFLFPVNQPPFYAFRNKLAFYNTLGGLKVDTECRVINHATGSVVDGLFAIGSDAGGCFGYYYNSSVTPGEMQGWCVASGFVTGNVIGQA